MPTERLSVTSKKVKQNTLENFHMPEELEYLIDQANMTLEIIWLASMLLKDQPNQRLSNGRNLFEKKRTVDVSSITGINTPCNLKITQTQTFSADGSLQSHGLNIAIPEKRLNLKIPDIFLIGGINEIPKMVDYADGKWHFCFSGNDQTIELEDNELLSGVIRDWAMKGLEIIGVDSYFPDMYRRGLKVNEGRRIIYEEVYSSDKKRYFLEILRTLTKVDEPHF